MEEDRLWHKLSYKHIFIYIHIYTYIYMYEYIHIHVYIYGNQIRIYACMYI